MCSSSSGTGNSEVSQGSGWLSSAGAGHGAPERSQHLLGDNAGNITCDCSSKAVVFFKYFVFITNYSQDVIISINSFQKPEG